MWDRNRWSEYQETYNLTMLYCVKNGKDLNAIVLVVSLTIMCLKVIQDSTSCTVCIKFVPISSHMLFGCMHTVSYMGPSHHGMACPQVVDGGDKSPDMDSNYEYNK
jgi:hypothetical protein